jgi:TPR repeat protein
MNLSTSIVGQLRFRPYPGLRAFEADEWSIFFGRERMIDEVIERLSIASLVFIHGASGSGKSSLVRAGVMPKLARQHLRHGATWLMCTIRPSSGPLWSLAAEFAGLEERGDDIERIGAIATSFNARGASLSSIVGGLRGLAGKNVCILVDQFEELFRFEKQAGREEAEVFVDLLTSLTAADEASSNVHVVVTMRSEFLGECARFDGLAETINQTQYLVPRMDDGALMRAVRRPAELYGGFVDEGLARRLIVSVRGRVDELPLLQHGLMMMWDVAVKQTAPGESVNLDSAIVSEAGGLAGLLSGHADKVMDAVAPDEARKRIVENVFRELTDVNAEGSAIRRPMRFDKLAAATGVSFEQLGTILDAFRAPDATLLTPYAPASIDAKTEIDISHEALIRCWRRISSLKGGWLRQEFDDGLAWRSLLVEALAFEKDSSRVLSAAATEDRSKLFADRNEFWSQRYGGGRHLVGNLLEASRRSATSTRRRAVAVAISLAALAIGAIGAAGFSVIELRKEKVAEAVALEEKANEASAAAKAKDAAQKAEKAEIKAEEEKAKAVDAAAKAERAEAAALTEREKAISAATAAKKAEDAALVEKANALSAASKAEAEKTKADQQNEVSKMVFANLLAIAQLRVPGKTTEQQFFERAKKLAENGNSVAADIVGLCYLDGLGTSRDNLKAREWFERSAAAGVPRAMLDMGYLYHFGRGVPIDFSKALMWYERAAAAGETTPLNNIGALYFEGVGVPKDFARAHQYFAQAALAGNGLAMSNIGVEYRNGLGVPKDDVKAREWFEKGIIAGEPAAMRSMGALYRDGRGVAQNYAKALEFFQMATDAGELSAMNDIGDLYYNGNGITLNYVKAREYFELGAGARTFITERQAFHGVHVPDSGRFFVPLTRLPIVLRNAVTILIKTSDVQHSRRVAEGSGFFVELMRFDIVL